MAQYNFRLFLKPTVIGRAIIDRLSAEGADRQADSRRWIELGYALEQAGFRLDGTTVFQGGRAVSSDSPVAVPVPAQWPQPAATPARAADAVETPTSIEPMAPVSVNSSAGSVTGTPSASTEPAPASVAPSPQPVAPAAPAPVVRPVSAGDNLADNLRSLSA